MSALTSGNPVLCGLAVSERVTGEQVTYFYALAAARGVSTHAVKELLARYGFLSSDEITVDMFDRLCDELKGLVKYSARERRLRSDARYDSSLSALTRLIYTELVSRCNRGKRSSSVSDEELARLYDITLRSVGRSLSALCRRGYINKEMKNGRRNISIPLWGDRP